jgi:hypothetical protein
MKRTFKIAASVVLILIQGHALAAISPITSYVVENLSSAGQSGIPLTFGQVFAPGDVPSNTYLSARLSDGTAIPLQADKKATHADGSLRHAVITTVLPSLTGGSSKNFDLLSSSVPLSGTPVSLGDLLSRSFDVTVSISLGGTTYTASAANLIASGNPKAWIEGPLATEWLVASPLKTAAGAIHPHLSVRFNVRAYAGLNQARVIVIVENAWSRVANPQNYTYNVTVSVQGKGIVLSQDNLVHYRQARWCREFWWGETPQIHIKHEKNYLQKTGSIPTYDPTITVPDSAITSDLQEFNNNGGLMERGNIYPDMPAAGGRADIAPLPRWTAKYIISQDHRSKTATVGNSFQAGSFGVHFRDENTDLPISLDTYPSMTIVGSPKWFPTCGGNCSTPYDPEPSHEPSLSYLPYLITGDHYHLEELQFWANWNLFYGPSVSGWGHSGSLGLVTWDQVRGQAWSLRTLGHAAYITPDAHPLKGYFANKLMNNIDHYNTNDLNWNPLGYITNEPWLDYPDTIATWMDDFLTWTFGHLAALGIPNSFNFANFKAKFPVGRVADPAMCYILASTYWPTIAENGQYVRTWKEYKETIILNWNNGQGGLWGPGLPGGEQILLNATCGGQTMADVFGIKAGEMIGYSESPNGYPSNMQPALAVAVELGVPDAANAWTIFQNRTVKPTSEGGYNSNPEWAIVPGSKISSNQAPAPPTGLRVVQ